MEKNQHLQTLAKLSASPSSFGPKREYYPLFGKCFAMQSNEKRFKSGSFEAVPKDFLFELCPFERVTQVGMESGAHPTLLGLWQGWDKDTENVMISFINLFFSFGFGCLSFCCYHSSTLFRYTVEVMSVGTGPRGRCRCFRCVARRTSWWT